MGRYLTALGNRAGIEDDGRDGRLDDRRPRHGVTRTQVVEAPHN
jgi:hypothetical protein